MPYNVELAKEVARAALRYVVYGPRVMILRDDAETTSKGGLIIPDEAQKRKNIGTVVKLGEGYAAAAEKEYVEGLEIGHRVTFNAYDGVHHNIPVGDKLIEVLVMHVGNLYMGRPGNFKQEEE